MYRILSANWTFSILCSPLIKSGSLNRVWSTNVLGQFLTHIRKFIGQPDIKHIMMSLIKRLMLVLKAWTDIIINIPTHPIGTDWDISDNFCLDFQNCCYSMCISEIQGCISTFHFTRFSNCPDYDLCGECEAIHGVHDPNHVFLKIRRPVRLRNKTPLLKQIIYRTNLPTEFAETRLPLFENPEEMLKNKMEK